jgi:hypothetical protein
VDSQGNAAIIYSPAISYSAPAVTQGVRIASSSHGDSSSGVQQNVGDNFSPSASLGAPAATSAAVVSSRLPSASRSSAQGHSGGATFVPVAAQNSYGLPRLP